MPKFQIVQLENEETVITPMGDGTSSPLDEAAEPYAETAAESPLLPPAEGSSMPQLDTDSFASQIFWLVLTFGALWLVLSRKLLPDIHGILENRQTKITHDLDRAEKLQSEAEAARENYERALRESRAKAQALISESSALMEKSSTARHAELDRKLEKQLSDAEANIKAAKSEALTRLAPVSKELTQDIVEKLTGKKIDVSEAGRVVDALIKEKRYG